MPEALPVIIVIAGIALFSFIAIPPLLHDTDTGASFFDGLFDVEVGNATDGNIIIFDNGTWVVQNQTGGGLELVGGDQITIIQNLTHAEFSLRDCANDQFLVWLTLTDWTCRDLSSINGTGGNGTSKIHVSLGNGDVFKDETATTVNFRGITNGTGIDMIINGTDIELSIKRCDETGLVFYNGTTELYECVTTNEFVADVIFDNTEFFPPHLSVGGGADTIVTFSNYSVRAIKFRQNIDEDSSWLFVIPNNLNVTNVTFDVLWFSQVTGIGTVCWELSTNVIQENTSLDSGFNQRVEVCEDATSYSADDLQVTQIVLTPVQSQISANDVALMKLERRAGGGNPNDDYNKDTFVIGGELRWSGD